MANLAVWKLDGTQGGESVGPQPQSVSRSDVGLEAHLEGWIEADPTLIGAGLDIVGRQVRIHNGRLDLLAIDSQDRWLVIEIKAGVLDSGALTQALYYASSLAQLSRDELQAKIEPRLKESSPAGRLSARVNELLENEGEHRDIALMLVGVGISSDLERMQDFLGRFDVPISVVSFEVFELDAGPKLLIREMLEEPTEPAARVRRPRGTVDMIRQRAANAGVFGEFDRFISMSEEAGLVVRPYTIGVMIAPPTNRARYLMYARPQDGGLEISAGPGAFAEFFDVTEAEASEALGPGTGWFLTGPQLEAKLGQIERFLTEKLRRSDGGG